MYCLSCGTNLPAEALFCLKCGRLVPKGNGASEELEQPSTLIFASSPTDPYPPHPSTSYGSRSSEGDIENPYGAPNPFVPLVPPPPPHPRRTLPAVLKSLVIAILVIVLLSAGLGGFLLFKQGAFSPSVPHAVRPAATSQPTVQSTTANLPGMWTQCAVETENCTFSGTMTVAFGANGSFNYATESNGTVCTQAIFGNLLPGTQKACYIEAVPPTTHIWAPCAGENAICSFQGTMTVAFGANGSYKYATKTNGVACTTDVFGDPLNLTVKSCYLISPPTNAATWNACAAEDSTCSFTGRREVAYGANGEYFYGSFTNGTACTNSVFGDPSANVVKTCYYQ